MIEFHDLLSDFLRSPPRLSPPSHPPPSPIFQRQQYYAASLPDEVYAMPAAVPPEFLARPRSNMWYEHIDALQFSRKIFVGKIPHYATKRSLFGQTLEHIFLRFGPADVDWPQPATHLSSNHNAPRLSGYLFLVYKSSEGVRQLMRRCNRDEHGEFHLDLGPLLDDVKLHIRLWRLEDADYALNEHLTLVPSMNTVFLGRLPRMSTAKQIAQVMEAKFGHVIYVQIDIDAKTKYPQGCAAVFFSSQTAYLQALKEKLIDLRSIAHRNWETEIKPFVCFGGICDECGQSASKHFCSHIHCLQYYCEDCWKNMHSQPHMRAHLPYKENKHRNLRGIGAHNFKKTAVAPKTSVAPKSL